MRAIQCPAWGELALNDVPEPTLEPGTVRLAVEACGVNFADTLIIKGKYQMRPEPPFSPGFEVAGTVLEVGEGVEDIAVGERRFGHLDWGGWAEQVVVPAGRLHAMPDVMSMSDAAGFPITYGTSHLGLRHVAGLKQGEVLLVHGAAGGVGLTAVEVGKRIGATVIATAGGAEKLEIAKAHGADHLIDYKSEDVRTRVKELTEGKGAHVVYDPVGGEIFEQSVRCTRPGGRMLVVGFASGKIPEVPLNIVMVKNISILGFYWGAYETLGPPVMAESFRELADWVAEGALKPRVSKEFALEDAAEALEFLKARKSTGKVVLRP